MTSYILATFSISLTILFFILYLGTNFFQAGCCVGCPYVGRFCPAMFGIYLSNFLSSRLYKGRPHESRFFKFNGLLAGVFLVSFFTFPFYWLLLLDWYYLTLFYGLVVIHFLTFLLVICPKCSYNDTCPGGKLNKTIKLCFS